MVLFMQARQCLPHISMVAHVPSPCDGHVVGTNVVVSAIMRSRGGAREVPR